MWNASDDALLAGYATGDADAAIKFVRRFQHRVYGLALLITRDRVAADDVAQEVFLRAWRYATSFDARRGSVETWLLSITRNQSIDRMRVAGRHRLEESVDEVPASLLASAFDTEVVVAERADVERVAVAMRSLPREQRDALVATTLLGLSAREISDRFELPLGTVKTRIRLALHKVRAELGVPVE